MSSSSYTGLRVGAMSNASLGGTFMSDGTHFSGIAIGSRGYVRDISGGPIPEVLVKKVVVTSDVPITEVNNTEVVIGSVRVPIAKAKNTIRIVSESEIYIDGIKIDPSALGAASVRVVLEISGCTILKATVGDQCKFTDCKIDSIKSTHGSIEATGDVQTATSSYGNITCRKVTGLAKTTYGNVRQTGRADRPAPFTDLTGVKSSKERRKHPTRRRTSMAATKTIIDTLKATPDVAVVFLAKAMGLYLPPNASREDALEAMQEAEVTLDDLSKAYNVVQKLQADLAVQQAKIFR